MKAIPTRYQSDEEYAALVDQRDGFRAAQHEIRPQARALSEKIRAEKSIAADPNTARRARATRLVRFAHGNLMHPRGSGDSSLSTLSSMPHRDFAHQFQCRSVLADWFWGK
jgi:hypothetical protein